MSYARREIVAAIASICGTALPVDFGGVGEGEREREDREDDGDRRDERGAEDGRNERGTDPERDAEADREVLTGVVDRIEGDLAVVLVERDGEVVDERNVPVDRLPADAREANSVLRLTVEDGDLRDVEYDEDETEKRLEEAQDRFDELAE